MSRRVRSLIVAANVLYAVILLILGITPSVPVVAPNVSDLVVHAGAYAIQAALLFVMFLPSTGRGRASVLAAAVSVAYGVLVETLQILQPARAFEIRDIGANILGAGLAASIAYLAMRPQRAGGGT